MGIFFNYDRPGPGVDKNAPKKKGVALFLELLWRYLGKLMLSNMLYFVISLPVLALYSIIIATFFGNKIPAEIESVGFLQIIMILTVLVTILWGTGPASCGFTYTLRNFAREEHVFIFSDFFEKIKESLKHSIVFLLVDAVMLVVFSVGILVYHDMADELGGIYTALYILMALMIILYTVMHFYLYEMEVTFQNKISVIYKNSFIMAIATLPMCLLLGVIVIALSFLVLQCLTPIAVCVVAFVCWISLMRFIVDFYTARVIKKNFLQEQKETNE